MPGCGVSRGAQEAWCCAVEVRFCGRRHAVRAVVKLGVWMKCGVRWVGLGSSVDVHCVGMMVES